MDFLRALLNQGRYSAYKIVVQGVKGIIKSMGMSVACSMHRSDKKRVFCSENLKGKGHSLDLGVDERVVLEWNLEE
jgi:hypothetical protein